MASLPSLDAVPASLPEAEFWRLFGRLEHERLDFKRGVPSDVRDAIPAMAMTDGGLIVHGVADDRQIVGCPLSQNTQDRITRFAAECGVEVQLREIAVETAGSERDGKAPERKLLTICAVPEIRERIVTTPDGRLLRRVGGDSQPLRGDAMARFVREREQRSGEEEPLPRVSASDFDSAAVNAALAAEGRSPIVQKALEEGAVWCALADLGVASVAHARRATGGFRAAAILFARDPRTAMRGAAVQLVRREGTAPAPGPTIARTEVAAPLAEAVEQSLAFIVEHTRRFEVVAGIRRQALTEYPVPALREALVNALAHRDYSLGGATVDVTVWEDRLEVRSPGPLPGHITEDNMRREHYSRNPRIMRVLRALGLVEEYGEGIDRMYREMEARLLAPPAFDATTSSVTVTLCNRSLANVEDQAWLLGLPAHVSANERRALIEARRDGAVTRRALRLLMTDPEVDAVLASAVSKGLLRRIGSAGGTRYVLAEASGAPEDRRRARLLDEIRRRGSITTAAAAEALQQSPDQCRRLLNELVDAGVLRAEGNTRARKYLLR